MPSMAARECKALEALGYLDKSEPAPESWRTQQLGLVERAKAPKASLLLMVVAPVEQLIESSGGQKPKS